MWNSQHYAFDNQQLTNLVQHNTQVNKVNGSGRPNPWQQQKSTPSKFLLLEGVFQCKSASTMSAMYAFDNK